ncbi:MAG: hypothetical protein WBJ34_11810, partial [Syntrophomonadaceae bacterium]
LSRSKTCPTAVNDSRSIFDVARMLYQQSGQEGKPLRLVGLTAGRLQGSEYEQLSLFANSGPDISSVIDRLNQKYTSGTIIPASLLDNHERNQ